VVTAKKECEAECVKRVVVLNPDEEKRPTQLENLHGRKINMERECCGQDGELIKSYQEGRLVLNLEEEERADKLLIHASKRIRSLEGNNKTMRRRQAMCENPVHMKHWRKQKLLKYIALSGRHRENYVCSPPYRCRKTPG
jgi:hypothetical protein